VTNPAPHRRVLQGNYVQQFRGLLFKDIAIEIRRGDVIITLTSMVTLLASLIAFAMESAPLTPAERRALLPYVLWLPTIIVGTIVAERLMAKEREEESQNQFMPGASRKVPSERARQG
jgi:ABC-type transport system involved in cytochrome c biogenesis permease component